MFKGYSLLNLDPRVVTNIVTAWKHMVQFETGPGGNTGLGPEEGCPSVKSRLCPPGQ